MGRLSRFQQQVWRSLGELEGGLGQWPSDLEGLQPDGEVPQSERGLRPLFKQGKVRTQFSLGISLGAKGRVAGKERPEVTGPLEVVTVLLWSEGRRWWPELGQWLWGWRGSESVFLACIHSFILLWAGLRPGTGDTVATPGDMATFFLRGLCRDGHSWLGCDSGQGLPG